MQTCTCDGLQPAEPERQRCTLQPILNANSLLAESLRTMWAKKSPAEAHELLSKPDVTVTNQSDKYTQLGKLLRLHQEVDEVMGTSAAQQQHPAEVPVQVVQG